MASLAAPVIPESYNPMDSFLRGFSVVAQINQRRQQSEMLMQKMALEADLKEKAFEFKQAESLLEFKQAEKAFELKQKQVAGATERTAERMDLSARRLELETKKQEFAEDKFRSEIDDTQALLTDIQHLSKVPAGTPERNAKLAEIAAKHPYASRNSLGKSVIAKEWEDHEGAVKSRVKLFHDKLDRFKLPYDAFENPQEWVPRPDKKRYREIVDATGRPQIVTIDDSTFKTLDKEFRNIVGASTIAPSRQMEEVDNKELDADTAKTLLNETGGDKAKARQLALERGYKL